MELLSVYISNEQCIKYKDKRGWQEKMGAVWGLGWTNTMGVSEGAFVPFPRYQFLNYVRERAMERECGEESGGEAIVPDSLVV